MWDMLISVYGLKTYVTFLLLYLNCKKFLMAMWHKILKREIKLWAEKYEQFTQELLLIYTNKQVQSTNKSKSVVSSAPGHSFNQRALHFLNPIPPKREF
jgi:hypothetical protein